MKRIHFLLVCIVLFSCTKKSVQFIDNTQPNDPDFSYFDNYPVALETYKIDSFQSSGNSAFTIGYNNDPEFGKLQSGAYLQIELPAANAVRDQSVSFDSLVVLLKPTGSYYGDTLIPFQLNVHRLTQKIINEDESITIYSNRRSFSYEANVLGSKTVFVKPKTGTPISIRLSDALGRELLDKFRRNNTDIQDNTNFVNYFNGLYLGTDTNTTKSLYYFGISDSNTIFKLYYKVNGAFAQEKTINFTLSSTKQLNGQVHEPNNTGLAVFTPFKTTTQKSSATQNKAFLHSNIGTYIKLSFPSILTLKDKYPFIKVVKAELVVKPKPGSYNYPYFLPSVIGLYRTDNNNTLIEQLVDATGEALTGNLVQDFLYGEKTQYTYNITSFINALISEGKFSTAALMLAPTSGINDRSLERLVINDQTIPNGVQLKLYVLGL